MSGFLLGVPGRLKTLLDRLTAGRAANLDQITSTRMARMDTTISSRAPSTATDALLARLTTGRASNLDEITAARLARLDQTVGSRATNAGVWTNGTRTLTALPSVIKSIQSGFARAEATNGTANTENDRFLDITISTVNVSKCVCFFDGSMAGDSNRTGLISEPNHSIGAVTARLTSSTNLRLGCAATVGSTPWFSGRWTVVEYS